MNDKVVKRVAADIGGTFTDIAAVTEDGELLTWKLPSTPPNFADAVSTGIEAPVSYTHLTLPTNREV